MPDLTSIPALDVAIGLSFVFLALSLAASAIQEFIANLLSLRAKVLERGLRNMLTADAGPPAGSPGATEQPPGPQRDLLFRVYTHPLVRSLYRESWFPLGRKTLKPASGTEATAQDESGQASAPSPVSHVRLPSYIAPRTFALALIDTIAPTVGATDDNGTPRPAHDVIADLRGAILALNIPSGSRPAPSAPRPRARLPGRSSRTPSTTSSRSQRPAYRSAGRRTKAQGASAIRGTSTSPRSGAGRISSAVGC